MAVRRFGISIDEELAVEFDQYCEKNGYTNRSDLIRDLLRKAIDEEKLANPDQQAIGAFGLVFDHGKHLNHKLIHERNRNIDKIVGTLQVQIDKIKTLEITVLRGKAGEIDRIGNIFARIRGVISGQMIYTSPNNNE